MNLADISPFYDFSLLEKAIQAFFCDPAGPIAAAGGAYDAPLDDDDPDRENWTPKTGIAFYTAFQNLTFLKCRPRVWLNLNQIASYPGARKLDPNGQQRVTAWTAALKFGIATDLNYVRHIALRTQIAAAIQFLTPQITADGSQIATTGVNALLEFHQLAAIEIAPASTFIDTSESGYYVSNLDTQISFSILPAKYPAA